MRIIPGTIRQVRPWPGLVKYGERDLPTAHRRGLFLRVIIHSTPAVCGGLGRSDRDVARPFQRFITACKRAWAWLLEPLK